MKHLYIQTAFLGDLLLAVPTLKQIRSWDVKSDITLVCRQGLGSLLMSLGLCDQVIEMDKKNKESVFKKLKNQSYDYVFCPHQSVTSHRLVQNVQSSHKIGYARLWNNKTFQQRVKRKLDWPEALRQMQLLAAVSEPISLKLEAFAKKPESIPIWAQMQLSALFWSDNDLNQKIKSLGINLKMEKPTLALAPGSVWNTKRWPEKNFVIVGQEWSRQGRQVIVIGAPEERRLCEKIRDEIPQSHSLAGLLSLNESLMFLSRCKGLICNDSGAMHMASLLHLPTIAVFGPTVQELGYKPWNPNAQVLEQSKLLCRPCGQHGSDFCPIGTHRCMTETLPQEVLHKAADLFI